MKKFIPILLVVVTLLSFGAYAKVGDVVGQALNTDIVAYINNYAIPSFAVNGQSCVVAEDLRNFGFDVAWNGESRSLSITKSVTPVITEMVFKKSRDRGSFFANVLETDIITYAQGVQVPAYAISGYTMVPMEALYMLGNVVWNPDEWLLDMTVEGFPVRETRQAVEFLPESVDKLYGKTYSYIKSIYGAPKDSFYYDGGVAFQYDGISFFFSDTYFLVDEPEPDAKCEHIYTLVSTLFKEMEGRTVTLNQFKTMVGTNVSESFDEMDEMYVYSFNRGNVKCRIYVGQRGKIAHNDLVIIRDINKY